MTLLCLAGKCKGKMEGWAAHSLSFAGRIELIKYVLHGMVSYWIHSFKIPVSISKELEKLFANFLWKGGIHAYSWTNICKPKVEGGVGIRRIQEINEAAGLKLIWKLCTSQSLWASWMNERYCKGTSFWEASICSRFRHMEIYS